ncbi:hypothetical protein GDO81_029070, partial [Engystomops pustulosus]
SCQSHENVANQNLPKRRAGRSADSAPDPIDCVVSEWSPWSKCDPCQKKRYRYTQMTQVPQFTGDLCFDLDRQEESCSTSMVCRNKKNCEGFTCEESGKWSIRIHHSSRATSS